MASFNDNSSPEKVEWNSEQEGHLVNEVCYKFPQEFEENQRLVRFLAVTCLRYRLHDLDSSVERLQHYFKWRRKLFGGLADQSCSTDSKLSDQLSTFFVQISPKRMPNGEGLVFLTMLRHNPSIYSAEDTVRCLHFIIMNAMMQDPSLAEKGFVLVNKMTGIGLFNLDTAVPKAIASAINKCWPVRVINMIVVNPPFVVRWVIPVVKAIVSSKMGNRIHVLDSPDELQQFYSLEYLPESVGGAIRMDDPAVLAELTSSSIVV